MPCAFNLMLDPVASLEIERLYAALVQLKIPEQDLVTQYGPCVTVLVVADRVPPDALLKLLEWKLPRMAAAAIRLTRPFMMPGTPPTLSLRVDPTAALLALHDAIYAELPEEEVQLHYRPAYWQPHLKLSNLHGDQAAAAALVAGVASGWRDLEGTLDHLEVMQYPPVQAIWQAPLPRPGPPASPSARL